MLINFLKKSTFFQNIAVNILTSVHPSIVHNLAKIEILKRAFWHTELEQIEGGYFEFGVYEGTSLLAAVKAQRKLKSKIARHFYGFDSFDDGFKYFDKKETHPFFREGDFVSSYVATQRRFKKIPEVTLVKGYVEETIAGRHPTELYGEKKCAVVFVDCDLMNPALVSLEFVTPIIQPGTVIILDDYWAYKGSPTLGPCGALATWLERHPNIKVRDYFTYGYGGTSFIVYAC